MHPNTPSEPGHLPSRALVRDDYAQTQSIQPFAQGEEDSGPNWGRAISALWRFKWLVLAVAILGSGAGYYVARMSRPVYTASTTIWIDQGETGPGGRGPLAGPGIYDPEAWLNLIRSFAVLDTVVSDLHLNIRFVSPDRKSVV